MYSNKDNINILTALLIAHKVTKVVVCPGSRNAPIIHNLVVSGQFECYPVTDERSAGFYALGMAQMKDERVAVCVTSGSALLNLLPAVSEAYYQHRSMVVISADRPASWIDQQDGQTIPQHGALDPYVGKSVTIAEPHTSDDRWYCNRLVNEALVACFETKQKPVHINVPLSEPLFEYTIKELPIERVIQVECIDGNKPYTDDHSFTRYLYAKRPLIVVGQCDATCLDKKVMALLQKQAVVLSESLSPVGGINNADDILRNITDWSLFSPDYVLYVGGAVVSKRIKQFLRQATSAFHCSIEKNGHIYDTFTHLNKVIQGRPEQVLEKMADFYMLSTSQAQTANKNNTIEHSRKEYIRCWHDASSYEYERQMNEVLEFSEAGCVRYLEEQLQDMDYEYMVHYGNSTSIRLANRYATRQVYCNRGVNGIEGSLSTAAGMSVVTNAIVFCVIGDLSFFYDQNALWNQNLHGNLRIVLLNNGGGHIFNQVAGMPVDEIRSKFIMAEHRTQAQGICTQNDVGYIQAKNVDEMRMGVVSLLTIETQRPVVLEVLLQNSNT